MKYLALALVIAVGCVDPSYDPQGDAGCDACAPSRSSPDARLDDTPDSGHADAATAAPDATPDSTPELAPSTSIPADAQPLVGRYAVRARFYARDAANSLVTFTHQVLMRAETRYANGALTMELEVCDDVGTASAAGVATTTRVDRPDKIPKRTLTVSRANGGFYTAGDPILIGFGPTPAGCSAGKRVPAPGQGWHADGMCACPASDALPTDPDDCRVIDSDNDGRPGMGNTFMGPIDGLANARSRDGSNFLMGVIDGESRHHRAQYQKLEEYFLLSCSQGTCPNSNYLFCPVALQPVLFTPLEALEAAGPLGCEDVRAREATLFPNDPLVFPSGC